MYYNILGCLDNTIIVYIILKGQTVFRNKSESVRINMANGNSLDITYTFEFQSIISMEFSKFCLF